MTKKRQEYLYQLPGQITAKKTKKKKDQTVFFQLEVIIPQQSEIKKINAFADSCPLNIWQTLAQNQYLGKNYLFFCKNFMGSYYLIDWKEVEHE